MRKARITAGAASLDVILLDTPTADAVWDALPISSRANIWGDEVYFSTPVSCPREPDARDMLTMGEIAFWPDGDAIAVVFGRTPISGPGEMRLASASNVWAHADGDPTVMKSVGSGDPIRVERIDG